MKKINILSIFSGCGGWDLPFSLDNNFKIVGAFDNWNHAIDIYKDNISKNCFNVDLLKNVPKYNNIDILIGSPSCTAYSKLGKRESINSIQGQSIYAFINVLKENKPMYFFMEQVLDFLDFDVSEEFFNRISDLGYSLDMHEVVMNDYGVSQKRKRLFVFGSRDKSFNKMKLDKSNNNAMILNDILENNPKIDKSRYYNESFNSGRLDYHKELDLNKVCNTITSSFYDQYFINKDNFKRRLSVRELARIQSFPDSFQFNKRKNLRATIQVIANSVPPLFSNTVKQSFLNA
ncbi:MAG: hypothetical protein CME69_12335 [Halobacteriovorax sp.]|nr:hypothetical protein [Halobacteriovorax sp.]|tara:strand:- start:1259 stop:2128 length:870 start_codon:yes stop_codon:yes gene_type:complete